MTAKIPSFPPSTSPAVRPAPSYCCRPRLRPLLSSWHEMQKEKYSFRLMKCMLLPLLVTVAAVCSTCQAPLSPTYNRHGLYRLTVAGGSCFGPCPAFALDMDSSLACTYYGGEQARRQGYYRGKVPARFWREAVRQLNLLPLDSLHGTYPQNPDAALVQFILYTSSGEKRFLGADGALPTPLFKLYVWIVTHDSALTLRPAADSIRFATFAQRGLPAPPAPTRRVAPPAN